MSKESKNPKKRAASDTLDAKIDNGDVSPLSDDAPISIEEDDSKYLDDMKQKLRKREQKVNAEAPESHSNRASSDPNRALKVAGVLVDRTHKSIIKDGKKIPMVEMSVYVTNIHHHLEAFDQISPLTDASQDESGGAAKVLRGVGPWLLPVEKSYDPVKKANTGPRVLNLPSDFKTIQVQGLVKMSVFTQEGKDGVASEKAFVKDLEPGAEIQVTDVIAVLRDGKGPYLNSENVNIISKAGNNYERPSQIIARVTSPDALEASAVLMSMTQRAWYGCHLPEWLDKSAKFFQDRFKDTKEALIKQCEEKAKTWKEDGKLPCVDSMTPGEVADSFQCNADRIKSGVPASYALGQEFFFNNRDVDSSYPLYNTAVVHEVSSMALPQVQKIVETSVMVTEDKRKIAPPVFAAAHVLKTEFTPKYAVIEAHIRLQFITNPSDAFNNLKAEGEKGDDWCLDSKGTAMGIKIDMRSDLPKYTGIVLQNKAIGIVPDIIKFGRWVTFAPIVPKEASDNSSINTPYRNGFVVDMIPTIQNIGVVVSEAFINEHLCDGKDMYAYDPQCFDAFSKIHEKSTDGVERVVSPPALRLERDGYQEITSQTFKIASAITPISYTAKEYRVWFPGAPQKIAEQYDDTSVKYTGQSDTEMGEKMVMDAANASHADQSTPDALDKKGKILPFLTTQCAVYVVAVGKKQA